MKRYNAILLQYLALISLMFLVSCGGGGGSNTPPPASAPAMQQIWKNGTTGIWFGNTLTPQAVFGNVTLSNVALTDNITGDTTTLRLTTSLPGTINASGLGMNFTTSVGQNASSYYSTGHLQFNIRLEKVPAPLYDTLTVSYGSDIYNQGAYTIDMSTLSTSIFTHISIPISLFNANKSSNVAMPFRLTLNQGFINNNQAMATLNDIKWTEN